MSIPSKHAQMKVYFDGLCPLCSREISYYRSKEGATSIEWLDITSNGFDAVAEGLDPIKVHQMFHVKDQAGQIFVGVDGFVQIWSKIPSLRHLNTLASVPGAKAIMKLGYVAFAKIRPYLPRKAANECQTDTCYVRNKK